MSHTVYRPADRPRSKCWSTAWFSGELHMWIQHADGSWQANVMWSRTHHENRLDTSPTERAGPPART